MDTALLSRMLKCLLSQYDSVSLPDFGKFILEDVPASFSDKGFTINPPYKKVVFVPVVGEDNILCESYSEANGVSMSIARENISGCVRGIVSDLKNSKQVDLPQLGKLKMTRGGTVLFVAMQGLELRPQLDMLVPISLKSRDMMAPEPVAAPVAEPVVEVAPEPVVEVIPEAAPESVAEPDLEEPTVEPEPEPVVESVIEAEPEPVVEPVAEPEPTPDPIEDPAIEPEPAPEPAPAPKKRRRTNWFVVLLIVLLVLVVLGFLALAVLGRLKPELVDQFLYTKEELEILNTVL